MCRELRAEVFEPRTIERHGSDRLTFEYRSEWLAKVVERGTVAGVIDPFGIWPDAIHADAVTEILDRAGAQQRLPRVATALGPVRHVDEHVVAVVRADPIATPDRKAQVVADERTDPEAAERDDESHIAGGVVLVLAGHAEEMALVVTRVSAV